MRRAARVLAVLVAMPSPVALTGCRSLARQGRDALGLAPKDESIHRNLVFAHRAGRDLKLELGVESRFILVKGQNHAFPLTASQVADVATFFSGRPGAAAPLP